MWRCCLVLAVAAMAGGCSYNAPTSVAPATNIYSSYDDRVPGRFALVVDADRMAQVVSPGGYACSAHRFPVDARQAFRTSVLRTFENIAQSVEPVERALSREQLAAAGYDGLIRVTVEDLDVDVAVIPGFWTAEIEADAELTMSLAVEGPDGRRLGTTVEGRDDHRADAGAACEGGAQAIGRAVEKAMKEALERAGERFTNAPRLRGRS
ncbi:MAG: hypothetical protein KatS3mg118_0310 [Paracoccaceae bacterium]|nr:MAG: hypothetical protein KatS3mg118_0310 [Paracoccaceae bacterium]